MIRTMLIFALFCVPATALAQVHDRTLEPHNWISKHKNDTGLGCCHQSDICRLPSGVAYRLKVGSEFTCTNHLGRVITGRVNKIYPSRDPNGVAWATKFGCIFIPPGM